MRKWTRSLYIYLATMILLPVLPSAAATVIVTVGAGGNYFSPASCTVDPGDTIKWVWSAGHHNTSGLTLPAGAADWYANITGTDTVFSYVPVVSGLYTYTCTHHSGMDGQFFVTGCAYPDKPVISSVNGSVACQGDTVHLYAVSQPGVAYQWFNGVITLPAATGPVLDVTLPGAYRVLVNRCGVDSVSAPFSVTIHPLPVAAFTYENTGLGYTFTSVDDTAGGYAFLWQFGDGSADQAGPYAVHTFIAPGTYRVTLTVTDTLTGCSDTAVRIIQTDDVAVPVLHDRPRAVFPNPATSGIYIQAPDAVLLFLTDRSGRRIPVPPDRRGAYYYLETDRFLPGLYLLHIQSRSNSVTEKISVVH